MGVAESAERDGGRGAAQAGKTSYAARYAGDRPFEHTRPDEGVRSKGGARLAAAPGISSGRQRPPWSRVAILPLSVSPGPGERVLQNLAESLDRFQQVFLRVRKRNPDISVAERAERGSGKKCNTGFVKGLVGEFL